VATGDAVSRTAAWIDREYGREKWPAIERFVDEAIAAEGPRPDLARVIRTVSRHERGWAGAAAEPVSVALNGVVTEAPRAAAVGAYLTVIPEVVVDACRDRGADLIVDMGSGWGQHLLSVWLAGGPRHAAYVAAEYTEAGRRASARLGQLAPEINFAATPFDLRAPDLSALGTVASAVVLTVHAIEQVPVVDAGLFDAVLALAPVVRGVHFEPIGWQVRPDEDTPARAYAARNDYNRNLWSVLQAEAGRGRIRLDTVVPDAVGLNPPHPTSLVTWTAVGKGAP